MSGPSFYLANEPQLLRKSEEAYLQTLHMWLKWKSIRSVCISDRTESLRGSHCPLRAAPPRDPLDTGGQAKPGARQPNGPVKSRRGSAESCTRIPARNHPGGSILAAIMAQFLTAIDNFPASIFSSHTLVQCERTNNRIRGLVCSHRERRMLFCHMIITVSVRSLSAKSDCPVLDRPRDSPSSQHRSL